MATFFSDVTREDPTKIGKTVQIAEDLRICIHGRSHATLSPAARRAGEIESGDWRVRWPNRITLAMARCLAQPVESFSAHRTAKEV